MRVKKISVHFLLGFFGLLLTIPGVAREKISLNQDWKFQFSFDVRKEAPFQTVNLPHTWNSQDVFDGKIDYYRSLGIYTKKIPNNPAWKNKRVFLYFEGANSVAEVFVNRRLVTQHRGGYTAFCAEITDFLGVGETNDVMVQVSNAARLDVLPLAGDFNIYGGLHRSVWLLVTEKDCISPLDLAGPGVYITTKAFNPTKANIQVQTQLSLKARGAGLKVRTTILDASKKQVAQSEIPILGKVNSLQQILSIANPQLWQGKRNPYLYSVNTQLWRGDQVIDEVIQPLGIRNFKVDPNQGFFLNGSYLDLYGFGYHQDWKGKGSALEPEDQEQDMQLIMESGATAMRLTHYPHAEHFYDLADQQGLVLWTEIPMVGPGGYTGFGYTNNSVLQDNIKQNLREMIRQKYNHPSICFWGLFNELKLDHDDPLPFLMELKQIVRQEDAHRLITNATFLDTSFFNPVSDVIAWNKYYGWYGGKFAAIGTWADKIHAKFPKMPIGISEYGAGANIDHHIKPVEAPVPTGDFHPEEWQTAFHEAHWEALKKRRFVWSKFIWAFADFGSSIRSEGGFNGLNDKGLITYDRKIKKDAFYFYKANWNPTPMIYLAEKRFIQRKEAVIHVKAFANIPQATLFVNGKKWGSAQKDELSRIIWPSVTLKPGINLIKVQGEGKWRTLGDSCQWELTLPSNKPAK